MSYDFWELHGNQHGQNEPYFTPNSFSDDVGQVKEMEAKLWVRFSVISELVHTENVHWWSSSVLFSRWCCTYPVLFPLTRLDCQHDSVGVQDEQSSPDGSTVQGLLTCTKGPKPSVVNMSSLLTPTQPSPHHPGMSQTLHSYSNHSTANTYLNPTQALIKLYQTLWVSV